MKKDENVKIILNNSNSLINRDNGIYKIYDNLFLNKNFIINLIDILKDLYDNNEFTIFNLHFLIKPNFKTIIKFDVQNLNKHLSKYPPDFLNENITRVYKNTGLLYSSNILVFLSLYDIKNLENIANSIKKDIKNNIDIINNTVYLDVKNTIENYSKKVKINKEIMLIINADFDTMNDEYKKFNNK